MIVLCSAATRRRLRDGAVLTAVLLLPGCSGLDRPEVEHVAAAFATGDPPARCALLAPATLATVEETEPGGCSAAVAQLPRSSGQVRTTSVWGDEAQVQLTDDTLFLTRTGNGWKVVAAGCRPHGDAPYECQVEGP
jgi:hypothetical protein